jgi:integrase
MARPKKTEITERFKILPHPNASGTMSWRVDGRMPDGRRVRKYFADEADAMRERLELEMKAAGQTETRKSLRTTFTPTQLADAEAAAQHAGPFKLAKVVAHYMSLRDRVLVKGIDLDQAIAFVETRYRPETKEITIFNAVKEFLASKVDLSPKTLTNYDHNLGLLQKQDPNKPVHTFTVTDIEKEMKGYRNLNTRRTMRRVFSVFFSWAERHHYCLENPCSRLDRLPKDTRKIVMLSLDEVKRALRFAINYRDGVMAAPVAIQLFAGLRPSEVEDLAPADIRNSTIIVRGGKKRREADRKVPIPEILRIWLEEFPFHGTPGGWEYKKKALKKATNAKNWVQDILRHTSISHQAERDKNPGLTEANNGTSRDMMNRHYLSFIDNEKEVDEFWGLTPTMIRKAKLNVSLPAGQGKKWPSKAALKKLVWQKPLVHAAKEIGVSDVALKKHCLKHGIELPRQGHWLRQ